MRLQAGGRTWRLWWTGIAVGFVFLVPGQGEARVFLRWGAGTSLKRALEGCGGRKVYETRVSFNGREGHFALYGFEGPRGFEVVAELSRRLPSMVWEWLGTTLALGWVPEDGGRTARVLIASLEEGRTLVYFFTPDREGSRTVGGASPGGISVAGLIPFPGSRSEVVADDRNRGVSLWIHRAPADAGVVRGYYLQQLSETGWLLQPPTERPSGSVAVLTRGSELCCLAVGGSGERDREVRITVLHKRRFVE